MSRIATLIAAGIFMAALAGCVGDEEPESSPSPTPEPEPEPQPLVVPWGLTDCRASIGLIPVSASAFGSDMPPGFTPLTPAEFGLPEDPRGNAIFGIEAFACASGVGLNNTTVDGIAYGSYFSPVHPPPEYEHNVTYHFVKWDVLIPDEDRRVLLADHEVEARTGTTSFMPDALQDGSGVFAATLQMQDEGTHQWSGPTGLPADTSPISFVELTPGGGEFVMWHANVTVDWASQGSGAFTFAANSFPTTIVGASQAQGYFLNFGGDFVDASIILPVIEGAGHHH